MKTAKPGKITGVLIEKRVKPGPAVFYKHKNLIKMNEEKKSTEKKGVMWMIPVELYDKLKEQAEKEKRSVTQQAILTLEKGLKCTQH